jgi:hypothetical protein
MSKGSRINLTLAPERYSATELLVRFSSTPKSSPLHFAVEWALPTVSGTPRNSLPHPSPPVGTTTSTHCCGGVMMLLRRLRSGRAVPAACGNPMTVQRGPNPHSGPGHPRIDRGARGHLGRPAPMTTIRGSECSEVAKKRSPTPRGVRILRSFSAAAMARRLRAPPACISPR